MKNKYIFNVLYQDNTILSNSYSYGHDICIVRDEDDDKPPFCTFTSPHLNNLTDPKEIWSRALSLISLYNGVENLFYNPLNEVQYVSNQKLTKMYIWENEVEITPRDHHEIAQTFPFDNTLNLDTKNLSKNNTTAYLIHLSKTKNDILHLLLQLGNGLDWINLYSIYDTVKTYSKGINKNHFTDILADSGHNASEIHAFTGTVNNYGILGVKARHGHLGWGTPQNILSLKESQKLITDLCKSYLKLTHPF
jgi:hypothetical protein